jgi:hypothetical protein
VWLGIAACFALTAGVGGAAAKSTVIFFSSTPSTTQAGAHPSVVTTFDLSSHLDDPTPPPCLCDDPKDIHVHTPAGVIADPHVVSMCSSADFAVSNCPADSQVGFVVLRPFRWVAVPLYRVTPQAGQAGLFGFSIALGGAPIAEYIAVSGRTGGDYGLDFDTDGVNHAANPYPLTQVFWGVPGAAAHDQLRFAPGEQSLYCQGDPLTPMLADEAPPDCEVVGENSEGPSGGGAKPPIPSSLPVKPFTQNPTSCVGPLATTLEVLAYDGETSHGEASWPATTGCDQLSFNPSLAAAPTTTETDSASGLAVDLRVPQFEDPETPSPSELKTATITLPEGFSINPNAADGKDSCSDAQANFTNTEAARCPEFSKVGTTELDSSALPGPIDGYIYLGEPKVGDRYRVIVTASGFGTNVKLAGSVRPDPATGQLVTSFENLPQAPFQEFNLHFFGSERGLLATPTKCGTYPVKTNFTPWASELSPQTSTQFFVLDSGPEGKPCPGGPRPFAPSLQAGVEDSTAAAHSPFSLTLTRSDGEQNLSALAVKTPPGFSATLKGVPYCPAAAIDSLAAFGYSGLTEQASSACPPASQIGSVIAGAGAGTHPVYLNGKAYLAGPYKGAPLSLVVVVPGVSGPYDLGDVAVRVALKVDETSAQITAISDPLPQILAGIPLRTRFIRVSLDRRNFALNPTNCEPFAVRANVAGDEGATASSSAHFQVANCADLGFGPRLALRMSGSTKRTGNGTLTATVSAGEGEANLKTAQVVLPGSQLVDNANIATPCTRVQFAANACPASSRVGVAKALSPLLGGPLEGPVYMRSSSHPLPDLVADLNGQFHIVVDGRVDQARRRIRTTFAGLPDVPVSSFTLTVFGGKHGILENGENLCANPQRARVGFEGQNGGTSRSNAKVSVAGCAKPNAKKHRQRLDLRPKSLPNPPKAER